MQSLRYDRRKTWKLQLNWKILISSQVLTFLAVVHEIRFGSQTQMNWVWTGFELPTLYSLHLPNPLGSKAICTLNVRSFQLKLFCSHWNLTIAILLQSCISLKLVYAKCKILTSGKKNIPVYQSTKGSLSF